MKKIIISSDVSLAIYLRLYITFQYVILAGNSGKTSFTDNSQAKSFAFKDIFHYASSHGLPFWNPNESVCESRQLHGTTDRLRTNTCYFGTPGTKEVKRLI